MSENKFQKLNKKEREIINHFALNTDKPSAVLKLAYSLFGKFITSSNKRSRELCRLKLLDLAGLNRLIPASELYAAIPAVFIPFDSNVSETFDDSSDREYSVNAILNHPAFNKLINLHVDGNETFSSLMLKNDRNGNPCIRSIKFQPNISGLSSGYQDISSSNESITRTIFISSCVGNEKRDSVSIMYDLVQQADFLFHVLNEVDLVIREIALVRMNVRACIFALEVFDLIYLNSMQKGQLLIANGRLQANSSESLEIKQYLEYIKVELIDRSMQNIYKICNSDQKLTNQIWSKITAAKDFQAFKILENLAPLSQS